MMFNRIASSQPVHWIGQQVFNRENPGAYFDPLLESINPLWVRRYIAAELVAVEQETHDTKTLVLRPAGRWGGFEAGQHLNLEVDKDGRWYSRPFSLSCAPSRWSRDGIITVTIKEVPDGEITPFLLHRFRPGDVLGVSRAYGGEPLPQRHQPALLIAGGSGITPVLSQLEALADRGYPETVTLLYFVRTYKDVIGAERLDALSRRLPGLNVCIVASCADPERPEYLNASHLGAVPDLEDCHVFVCGPPGLMEQAQTLLRAAGVADDQVHSMLFAVGPGVVVSEDGGGTVRFETSGLEVESRGDRRLLEEAEAAGLNPRYGCRMGICHQCSCRKTRGVVINQHTGQPSGHGEENIQLCISVPRGPVSLDL